MIHHHNLLHLPSGRHIEGGDLVEHRLRMPGDGAEGDGLEVPDAEEGLGVDAGVDAGYCRQLGKYLCGGSYGL